MQQIAYGHLGLKPSEFWELTPREFDNMAKGYEVQQEREWKKIAQMSAWIMQSNGSKVTADKLIKKPKVSHKKVTTDEKQSTLNDLESQLGEGR